VIVFRKVTFQGHSLWFDREKFEVDGDAPLAPDTHVKDGKLDLDHCFDSDTFAHVWPGRVMRYWDKIGTPDEIVDGWVSETAHAADNN
jgi:hypothetical protein